MQPRDLDERQRCDDGDRGGDHGDPHRAGGFLERRGIGQRFRPSHQLPRALEGDKHRQNKRDVAQQPTQERAACQPRGGERSPVAEEHAHSAHVCRQLADAVEPQARREHAGGAGEKRLLEDRPAAVDDARAQLLRLHGVEPRALHLSVQLVELLLQLRPLSRGERRFRRARRRLADLLESGAGGFEARLQILQQFLVRAGDGPKLRPQGLERAVGEVRALQRALDALQRCARAVESLRRRRRCLGAGGQGQRSREQDRERQGRQHGAYQAQQAIHEGRSGVSNQRGS